MLWIRCTGRDSRLVSMPITYCSYTFISAMRCSSAKLATASPSSSSPASCLDSSPAPREVAASKTAPPPASRTSEMKPRLSQIERFLRTTSVAMPSSDAKSASAHLCCAPNRSRIVACSGLHCTSPTLPSGKVTSRVTVPRDAFHTSLRGALMCANCFSKRAISFFTPAGSVKVSVGRLGQHRRETTVASISVAPSPPPETPPKCCWIEREMRRDSATSVSMTSHAESAASPNRFLRSSRLRTSFSVSCDADASSFSESILRNSLTNVALEP
mmetsp:Transcript_44724/g.143770  ORF Transcript_44724/g.143770 Transcript_44724/m.143770 type:complete len:272 (+) Transcript_44724:484-1299(+)